MPTLTGTTASSSNVLSFARPASLTTGEKLFAGRLERPMLVQAKPQPRTRGELTQTSALAHDARNALTALGLISGLLREPGILPPDHAHVAGDLQAVADTLGGLIGKFESGGAGRPAEQQGPIATAAGAGQALQDCSRLLQAVAGPTVQVHVSAESGLQPLKITADALSRVLANLVKNASEAMPKGGTVRITARRALSLTAPAVLIHVSDDGDGIPAFALGQIFEPGFTSKENASEACGLGLAIVRELVEAAGGKVRVASTRKRGTTFELRLPCLTGKR